VVDTGPEGFSGDAFGLRVSCDVAIAGLEPLSQRPARQTTVKVERTAGALGRRDGREVLYRDGEPPELLIDRRPGGYGVWSPRVGRHVISEDGLRIRVALPPRRWPWRLLFAQTLPIAAAIQGLEVVHASAVAVRGGVVAIVAPSGSGKSTLAAALVRRGAQFVADDVLALERAAGGIIAHPGVGITNASTDALRRGIIHQGVIARTTKHHLAVARVQQALPLSALVFLERLRSEAPARVERVQTPDPFKLLGSTFVFVVRDPRRLISQLDVYHAIAAGVCVLRARLPWTDDLDALAGALEPHLP